MPRAHAALLVPLALLALPGCFWGEADADMFFKVSGANADQFEDLLYPASRKEAWLDIFGARPVVCSNGEADCGIDETERSDLVDLYLPYKTSNGRGLITQKGDLQVTTHLDVGAAYQGLVDREFSGWSYLDDAERVYGWSGDSCVAAEDGGSSARAGVGRCVKSEVADHIDEYTALGEDLRLVLLINLITEDDVRSTECQDALERPAWDLPRTLHVNYNARQPEYRIEGDEGSGQIYGEETPPLLQCDIEVFARLQLGIERFEGDFYGEEPKLEDGELNPFTLDRVNDADSTLRGTVELESLALPADSDDPRAVGRFEIAFTSDRFGGRDGKVIVSGSFNAEIRADDEQLQAPERETEIGGFGAADPGA
jgi:hypothetical protein